MKALRESGLSGEASLPDGGDLGRDAAGLGAMRRPLLFVDQSGELGGAELSLLDIARHRRGDGEVLLLSDGPFRRRLEAEGVKVAVEDGGAIGAIRTRGLGAGVLRALMALPGLVRRVARRARQADVVYANTQKAMAVAVLGRWLHRRPVIWHLRDIVDAGHFGRAQRFAIRCLSRGLDQVIANSQASAAAFDTLTGGRIPVEVIHNGIDAAPFEAARSLDRQALRAANGLPADTLLVGLFGRLAPWKGQHVLLEAVSRVAGMTAVLVGAALFGEGAYEQALRERAAEPDLCGRVQFLGFREDVADLMHCVDVVVHASVSPEPFGRVVVEGMLARKPVVATAAGGVPEIIEHGVTGWLVQPGDAGALADALARLCDDEQRDLLSGNALDAAILRFAPQAILAAIDRVIAGVIRSHRFARDSPAA
ncbi:glycosyltransferase family 4 protein [Cupriavidus basilensis]|uniref:Glycosyltransferase family 4 protein n=1 Tax=Cupriavidus basilensis TaxID=68895 RepID=A0ABT6B3V1_9BURK|nr:glycosyltransferase family 4 protein [Cupriavidus basilensis]MDF3839478.1 glycosyltransferase family 4 protein [Cupriavidus basilensis]